MSRLKSYKKSSEKIKSSTNRTVPSSNLLNLLTRNPNNPTKKITQKNLKHLSRKKLIACHLESYDDSYGFYYLYYYNLNYYYHLNN